MNKKILTKSIIPKYLAPDFSKFKPSNADPIEFFILIYFNWGPLVT